MTTCPNPLETHVRVRFHTTYVGDDCTIPEGAEGYVVEESDDRVTVELITPVDGICLVTWQVKEGYSVFATSLARQHIEEVRSNLYRLTVAVTYEVEISAPSEFAVTRWFRNQSDPLAHMDESQSIDIQSVVPVARRPRSIHLGLSVNEQGEETRGTPLRMSRRTLQVRQEEEA